MALALGPETVGAGSGAGPTVLDGPSAANPIKPCRRRSSSALSEASSLIEPEKSKLVSSVIAASALLVCMGAVLMMFGGELWEPQSV